VIFGFLNEGNYLTSIPEAMLPLAQRYGCERVPVTANFWNCASGAVYRKTSEPVAAVTSLISILQDQAKRRPKTGENLAQSPTRGGSDPMIDSNAWENPGNI